MATRAVAALAMLYLVAHLFFLPRTLEDLDSINFALGVRDFDVAAHQPHPPGYPIFIALAKGSTALLRSLGVQSPEVRGLAIWSALSGALLILVLFALFRELDDSRRRAACAAVVVGCSPLVWFSGLRPLSDMTGLVAVAAAQALILSVVFLHGSGRTAAGRRLIAGAFVAGLIVGIRAQSFVLTLPLIAFAMLFPAFAIPWRQRLLAPVAFAAGAVVWGVPLLLASGGLQGYVSALGAQGGEDLGGVPILWTMRTGLMVRESLLNTYIWPWGGFAIAAIVLAAAGFGALRVAWRAPRVIVVLAVAFGPYAVFHPLFHDVANVRNALPLVLPVAYLAVVAVDMLGRSVLAAGTAALVVASLWLAVPASAAFKRDGSPTFRMLADMRRQSAEPRVLGFHASFRRAVDWAPPLEAPRLLRAPHGHEWLQLVEHWRAHPDTPAWFAADPRRSDLALIDPRQRRVVDSYRWPFKEPPYVGGARPGNTDWYEFSSPGWMLDRGWALSAEVAGVTTRDRLGPNVQPVRAWIRGRNSPATLVLGGRNTGPANIAPMHLLVRLDGELIATLEASPGFFVHRIEVPSALLGRRGGYLEMTVQAMRLQGPPPAPIVLEQFDLQSPGVPMLAYEQGWHEPEYNLLTGKSWRWMSEQATMWVRPVGRDVTLRIAGESPMRYYERAPTMRVMIGNASVAEFNPSADFVQEVTLTAAQLIQSAGRVTLTSDTHFIPGEREGTGDRRHLAVRIYSVEVR